LPGYTLTQKLFRAIDALELTDEGSLIDRFNRMEKRGLVKGANECMKTYLSNVKSCSMRWMRLQIMRLLMGGISIPDKAIKYKLIMNLL